VLSPSEAKYKYFSLTKSSRDMFPKKDQIFKTIFKNKKYELKVNNKNCIMLTSLYSAHEFLPGQTVSFKKIKENEFELSVDP